MAIFLKKKRQRDTHRKRERDDHDREKQDLIRKRYMPML
jgi:hypothetical protein